MYKLPTLVAVLLFASPVWSEEPVSATGKPSIFTTQTRVVTAVIETINYETREVTLRGPEGQIVNLVASEEARNLKQAKVGDTVIAEYVQKMSIEVFPPDGTEPGAGQISAMGRSEEGEMPAMTAIDALVVEATVVEINTEANTFKLRGPSGEIKEYAARDPENLRKAAVGDLVVITFTEAVAITVEKAAGE